MRTFALILAGLAALGSLAAAPAGGQLCYDVDVVVGGEALVDESGCEELPTP